TAAQKISLEAEKAALERKEKADRELDAARNELKEQERRLGKREDLFERKEEALSLKESTLAKQAESLRARDEAIVKKAAEVDGLLPHQRARLLQISNMSPQQAREILLQRIEEESRHDVAKVVKKITEEAEAHAKEKAREITLMAVQRYATEHTAE